MWSIQIIKATISVLKRKAEKSPGVGQFRDSALSYSIKSATARRVRTQTTVSGSRRVRALFFVSPEPKLQRNL